MKHYYCLLGIVLLIAGTLPTLAQFTGTLIDSQGVEYTANNDETTCYVSNVSRVDGYYITVINIPEEYEGRRVTSIGERAFENHVLYSVTIPSSVASIGRMAFLYCSGLTSITIPSSVTSIGDWAFSYCSDLTSIVVDENNPVYDSRENCNAIIRKSDNTLIVGLKNTIIPSSVTSIGDRAFSFCSGLTSITIPSSVTSIGDWAFSYCRKLTSINLLDGVTSIGEEAFSGCSGLASVTIPSSVTSIGDRAFSYCSKLTSINLLDGVTSIGEEAFYDCGGLTSVTIPSSVTSIGKNAFSYCKSLTSVHINDISTWCNITFINNRSNPLEYAHHLYLANEEIKDLIIPNSVTSIGEAAFCNCSGLNSVTIPSSVTSIGERAFENCSGLTSVTIPSGVTSLDRFVFNGCSGLTSVMIPASVTSIDRQAFEGCSGITSFIVDENNSVFDSRENCNSIIKTSDNTLILGCKNTIIPSSVTSIGYGALAYCDLTSIVVDENNPVFDSRDNCNAIIRTSDNTLIAGCKNTIIPSSVTSIGGDAFRDCSGLTSVTIPSSVTSIGYSAFMNCNRLTSATIPSSVTSIGWYAFAYCGGLTAVKIPSSVTSIGGSAFYGCSGLTSIIIPSSVTSIGGDAFSSCRGLTSVIVGWDTPLAFDFFDHFLDVDLSMVTLYVPKGTKEAYEIADVWKNFGTIIEYEKDNVLNEEDTTVPPSAIDVNVKVMRTINANEWSTICLPFAMTAEQVTAAFGDDVKIGDFDGYDTTEGDGDVVLAISMKFKQVTAMEANHPYVIKVSSKITEFSVEGVDLMPVENPVWAKTSGEMVGTYVAETVIPSGSMFLSGNKFWYSVGNSKMKAFRAYFHLNDVLPDLNGLEPAARVYLAFEDETTEIDATLIKSNEEPGNDGWHTLDGQKLAKMPTKKGVYVANGRKVVIK